MGIVREKANFRSSEIDSTERKLSAGKRNWELKKNDEEQAPVLVSPVKHMEHVHAQLSPVLVT